MDGRREVFPTRPRQVYDITGAGDMVMAVLGMALAAGADYGPAIRLANVAGGLEVEKIGVATVSREEILARIRDGLRTPAPPIDDKTFYGPIFEAVENPLERFQQECKANLMECQLTADATASAQALAQVLESLPPGEIFLQDSPALG